VRLIIIGINVAGVAGIVMSDPQVETAAVGGGMARELVNAAEVGAAIRVIAGIERDRRKRQDVPVFLVFGMELHERVREVCAHPFACWFASLSNLSSSVWREYLREKSSVGSGQIWFSLTKSIQNQNKKTCLSRVNKNPLKINETGFHLSHFHLVVLTGVTPLVLPTPLVTPLVLL
jgi:hypothetical protein